MAEEGDRGLQAPPKYGLRLPLDHEFPIETKQVIKPTAKQIFELIPLFSRYIKYYLGKRFSKKRPIMDYFTLIHAQRMYGCPIGGIGGGTIGRGFKGEFCRFQLIPGLIEYDVVPECQFIVNIRNGENTTLFQSILSTSNTKKGPPTWECNLKPANCEYLGLYPRAWTNYNLQEYGIKLTCRQISPIIPHNYKDSSLPCAVFVWSAENVSKEQRHVSITFTWTELKHSHIKTHSKIDIERYAEEHTSGITLEQKLLDIPCTFTIAKNKLDHENIHDGYCTFSTAKSSAYVWDCIKRHGKLEPEQSEKNTSKRNLSSNKNDKEERVYSKKIYKPDSMGLSSVISLDPGGCGETEFSLAWDMPIIKYKKDSKSNKRFYTKYFGSDGIAGASIAAYAIKHYKRWEKQIAEWQEPILNNSNIPDWLKSALMNELYYVADGGTIWFDAQHDYPETDPRHHFGVYAYLEGHEYRMYNTYDVHFYASFALAQLWPNLQVVIQYMYRDTIGLESEKSRKNLYDGEYSKYKVKDSIPHDLGDPDDEPLVHINCYNIHDVSEWRDLNLKFVLQVIRDYRLLKCHSAPFANNRYNSLEFIDHDVREGTEDDLYVRSTNQSSAPQAAPPTSEDNSPVKPAATNGPAPSPVANILELLYKNDDHEEVLVEVDEDDVKGKVATWDARQYLSDMYDACVSLLRRCQQWDRDNDGLIENSGLPDQTYDVWIMTGPSAYCGGLWLAVVSSVRTMARILERTDDEIEFSKLLEKGKQSFEDKLWNGTYYKFDTKPGNERVVMSDQLAGHWYLRAAGITDEVFPEANAKKALRTIYENNVLKFSNGKMGAINGYVLGDKGRPGHIDHTALQSAEMWTGVTYGLAALMIYEGMHEEAFTTAGGMHKTLVDMGLSFETPEALTEIGNHRSVAYMRPLSVWAMYQAITARPPPPSSVPVAAPNGHLNHTKDKL